MRTRKKMSAVVVSKEIQGKMRNISKTSGNVGITLRVLVCLGAMLLLGQNTRGGEEPWKWRNLSERMSQDNWTQAGDKEVQINGEKFKVGETIYENPMSSPEDVKDWVVESSKEGNPVITSSPENEDMLRLQSQVHFLLWCPEEFPDNIAVSWDFLPVERVDDRGLAMFWMAATGKGGKDLFDPSLAERHGHYGEYLKGDINALHISYFRRNEFLPEVNFQIVTLRKTTVNNSGPRMATGPDPIPAIPHVWGPFRIRVIKYGPHFRFSVNGLSVLEWKDEGKNASVFKGGKIGFRQMRGLIADYSNLKVQRVTKDSDR